MTRPNEMRINTDLDPVNSAPIVNPYARSDAHKIAASGNAYLQL